MDCLLWVQLEFLIWIAETLSYDGWRQQMTRLSATIGGFLKFKLSRVVYSSRYLPPFIPSPFFVHFCAKIKVL